MPAWSPKADAPRSSAAVQIVVVLVVIAVVAVGAVLFFRSRKKPVEAAGPAGSTATDQPAPGTNPGPKAATGQQPGTAAASLAEVDAQYQTYFVDEATKDRKKWEGLRAQYSEILKTLDAPEARKPVVEKLGKLNDKVLFSRDFQTADSITHKVEPQETIEKISTDYNLPRDCSGAVARINRTAPERVRVGETLKVIKPLKMDIRVSKKHLRLTAYLNGYFFGEFPVGIGMDDATPAGEFAIKAQGKDKNPNWTKTLEDGSKKTYKFGDPENILGTRWMGLEEKEGAVGLGIHGTTKDDTVPGRKSAGCIRMHNADVELLYDFTPDGTKVTITNN